MIPKKRITVFAGHYGSGKTNIAVNYALTLKETDDNVAIADLDIVNPYFRTKDSFEVLSKNNIRLISSEYAGTNVDVPALPAETYAITDDKTISAVIDVGGDDRGALALGRYTPAITEENNYEFIFVINKFRPLTRTATEAFEVMKEIESAAKLKFTGIVNNSNIGEETTAEDIISSDEYAEELKKLSGLPIYLTTVKASLLKEVEGKVMNPYPLTLYVRQSWEQKRGINMAKVTFNKELCKGCGLCTGACPKQIVKLMENEINSKGYHPAGITNQDECIGCAFCATMCPDCVITVEK